MSDDWWVDYRQNRQIRELQGEVEAAYSYAASRSRALQSRLSQVQGTLERRLDRLAKSFDAFVELSDVRVELAVFDREVAVRHRTRRLLMGLSQGAGDPPPLDLDDCPGYWLKPAADGLSALVRGDKAAADKLTAEAVRRDEDRTTLFLTLGLAIAGRYAEAVPWLSRSLPALGTTVTTVQRELWIACADGAFGEPGRTHIERRLTELVEELPPEAVEEQQAQLRLVVADGTGKARAKLPRELQNTVALTEPPLAADRLARLRTCVAEALRPADATTEAAAEFAGLLNTLVDEGSPEERPLIARARELRQIIEKGGTEQQAAWDAPAGDTLVLLRGDLFARGESGARTISARVLAPWIRTIAEGLTERALLKPPATVDTRVYGHPLGIDVDGAPALSEVEAEMDQAATFSPTVERVGQALTIGGLVLIVGMIALGITLLAILSGVVIIVGASIWIKERKERLDVRMSAEHDKDRLERQVAAVAKALKNCHSRHTELTKTATADREAILTLLP